VRLLQQNLLEEDNTLKRLTAEKEILTDTVKYFSAASALKDVEASTSEEDDKK
jgi:ATP-dependent Lon protease